MLMRLSRPRLTIGRLMIVVAVVAILLVTSRGLRKRSECFADVAAHHASGGFIYQVGIHPDSFGPKGYLIADWRDYSVAMERKYRFAARMPFLPVWPDPPEPN